MLKNLTPKNMRCTMSASCPGVYQLDDGRLIIVGELAGALADHHNIGWSNDEEEYPVVIDPALLSDIPEIARLHADNAVLREALGPFAKVAVLVGSDPAAQLPDYYDMISADFVFRLPLLHFRSALAALSENEDFMCQADALQTGDKIDK